MRIAIIGGGPGGLYFASLMKQLDPRHEITVWERNRADDTFGFGVVFSDETLGGIGIGVVGHVSGGALAETAHRRIDPVGVATRHKHPGALGDEGPSRREAESAGATGDQEDAVVQLEVHPTILPAGRSQPKDGRLPEVAGSSAFWENCVR